MNHMIGASANDHTNRADRIIEPQCSWETDGARIIFSNPFRSQTQNAESEHYILYWRRSKEGGEAAAKLLRGHSEPEVHKCCVAAYKAEFMRRFFSHRNVELCMSRTGAIKYLFKYICKYCKRANMDIDEERGRYSEIEQLEDARCVSASSSSRRFLAFEIINETDQTAYRLEVHTERHHIWRFRKEE